jgi:hypothetical protein
MDAAQDQCFGYKKIATEGCDVNHAIVAQVCVMKSLFRVVARTGGRQQSDHGNIR